MRYYLHKRRRNMSWFVEIYKMVLIILKSENCSIIVKLYLFFFCRFLFSAVDYIRWLSVVRSSPALRPNKSKPAISYYKTRSMAIGPVQLLYIKNGSIKLHLLHFFFHQLIIPRRHGLIQLQYPVSKSIRNNQNKY